MTDWVEMAYEGMRTRQAARAKAAEEKASLIEAEEAKELTKAEKEAAAREARMESERERAERIAARVQETQRLRAAARRPMTAHERQMAGQALGEGWDNWDGPGGPTAA